MGMHFSKIEIGKHVGKIKKKWTVNENTETLSDKFKKLAPVLVNEAN